MLYESYARSRVPTEATTLAILTNVASVMKFSSVLTSAVCEKDVHSSISSYQTRGTLKLCKDNNSKCGMAVSTDQKKCCNDHCVFGCLYTVTDSKTTFMCFCFHAARHDDVPSDFGQIAFNNIFIHQNTW